MQWKIEEKNHEYRKLEAKNLLISKKKLKKENRKLSKMIEEITS